MVFVVGEAEPWIALPRIAPSDLSTGCILWKQAVETKHGLADKYGEVSEHPAVHSQHGSGPITVGGTQTAGFKGAIAHLAVWNRVLSAQEIASIWAAGANDLALRPCIIAIHDWSRETAYQDRWYYIAAEDPVSLKNISRM